MQKSIPLNKYLLSMDIQQPKMIQQSTQMHFRPIEHHHNYKDKIRVHLNKLMMMDSKTQWNQVLDILFEFKFLATGRDLYKKIDYHKLRHPKMESDMKTPVIDLVAKMARTVLEMQGAFKQRKIPILQKKQNQQIELSKDQVLYIMCLLALNLLPVQPYAKDKTLSQTFTASADFSWIFTNHIYKTKALLNYFIHNLNNPFMDKKNQKFIIRRKCIPNSIESIINNKGSMKMIPYKLRRDNESIESFSGSGKVDFANEYIGGGALHGPCVQEEIMFANCPEMFVSMVFCQAMDANESIVLEGFKKYSSNTGYGQSTDFDHEYQIDWEKFYKINEYVIAIDAEIHPENQFKDISINRELLKSYCGFFNLPENVKDVVTGNWGCGAFGGEITVKFITQWISCSLAGKRMLYCPFGASKVIKPSENVLEALGKKKIRQVYDIMLEAGKKMQKGEKNIFKRIQQLIK